MDRLIPLGRDGVVGFIEAGTDVERNTGGPGMLNWGISGTGKMIGTGISAFDLGGDWTGVFDLGGSLATGAGNETGAVLGIGIGIGADMVESGSSFVVAGTTSGIGTDAVGLTGTVGRGLADFGATAGAVLGRLSFRFV